MKLNILLKTFTGYWVNEIPVHLNFLKEIPRKSKSFSAEVELSIQLPDDVVASGVAELFLSRTVSTATMIK